ncbi:hypothetical protein SALIVB_0664 [Streptococcus salivarius CCHSS3]|nr:hypothetical protein SALIVB_0664 [Streptococcus salivarius CCHSS3]
MEDFDQDKQYDVSKYRELPYFAKLKSDETMDANISEIVENILRLVVKKFPTGESTHYFFFVLK